MLHCDLRLRWKVASDLRFRAAISEPKTPSFCGISGDLAPSTRKSLAIAIVRFWCAKACKVVSQFWGGLCPLASSSRPPGNGVCVCLVLCLSLATSSVGSLSGSCQPSFISRDIDCQPAKEWDLSLGFLYSVCTSAGFLAIWLRQRGNR